MDNPRTWNFVDLAGQQWHCHESKDGLAINAVTAEGRVTDRIVVTRADDKLHAIEQTTFPGLEAVAGLRELEPVLKSRAWLERLQNGALQPLLVHTSDAARVWPIFGKGEFPDAGACNVQGAVIVWSKDLDIFVDRL